MREGPPNSISWPGVQRESCRGWSPECELKKKATARPLDLSTSDLSTSDGKDAAEFAKEPLADAEWTTEYERERKADEETDKTFRDRFEGTEEVTAR